MTPTAVAKNIVHYLKANGVKAYSAPSTNPNDFFIRVDNTRIFLVSSTQNQAVTVEHRHFKKTFNILKNGSLNYAAITQFILKAF